MVRLVIVVIGVILLFIGIIAFFTPIANTGFTIPMANDLCNSDWMEFALMFSKDPESREACNTFGAMTFSIYGISLMGIILVIVGAVKKSTKTLICEHCNIAFYSEVDLINHKNEKHLDKSPYKCEHCDYIGKTEEELWDHYNDKHPDEKKW